MRSLKQGMVATNQVKKKTITIHLQTRLGWLCAMTMKNIDGTNGRVMLLTIKSKRDLPCHVPLAQRI